MQRPNVGTTCLSSEYHQCAIKDQLVHYFGCIEICDRKNFFEEANPLWNQEIEHRMSLGQEENVARERLQKKRVTWEANCKNELRRFIFLRETLSNDKNDSHLVKRVVESGAAWRGSREYEANIYRVRQWRKRWREERDRKKGISHPEDVNSRPEDPRCRPRTYDPNKDVNVPIIQFNEKFELVDIVDKSTRGGSRVWGSFPNQKTTISKLFDEENLHDTVPKDNLLHKVHSQDHIRYFHIPSNNMIWAEQAIGKYFGQDRPKDDATHQELRIFETTNTDMILREPYWRSQLHGDEYSSLQGRHLRSLCTKITSGKNESNPEPKHMVLFMPYLHWDTSRKRAQFAEEIDKIMKASQEATKRDELEKTEARQEERKDISKKRTVVEVSKRTRSRIELAGRHMQKGLHKNQLELDENGRLRIKDELGQYLLDASRLYKGMSNYRDKMLLRKYLPKNRSLHPRRTLDQAYYWTLNSTTERDQDQVVYRGTTAKSEQFHSYDPQTGRWPKHDDFEIKGACGECKSNIRKVSRVIMVDQLWMWILDEKTIITCFPKRYGANKNDSAGVHKSIRIRLANNDPGQLRSVFDLALIIIDECSNTVFDRTKKVDRQPQVIDVFSKAIGNIMHKQTVAFERLWKWTDQARKVYRSRGSRDTSDLHVPLLDINPEGKLEREIKDIIEELDIMLHITKTHEKILKSFIHNAEQILDPHGNYGPAYKMSYEETKNQSSKIVAAVQTSGEALAIAGDESTDGPVYPYQDHSQKGQPAESYSEHEQSDKKRLEHKRAKDYHWFKQNADDRLQSVEIRIKELEELRNSAISTSDSVKDLLELKQQQASVVQAWQAVKQSEETIKQGRTIMTFTLVTIVFLPLSFLSSVFGMNNIEFSNNSWGIIDQFAFMFPISAGVILISLFFALSAWLRAGIWWMLNRLIMASVVRSGLYDLWLNIDLPSKEIHNHGAQWADKIKHDARRNRLERRQTQRKTVATKTPSPRREDGDSTSSDTSGLPDQNGQSKGNGEYPDPFRRIWEKWENVRQRRDERSPTLDGAERV